MGRINAVHTAEFAAIKALCYQGLDSATLRTQVGARLSRHLRAPSFCFGLSDPASALPVHSFTVGLAPDYMDTFCRLVLATPSLDFGAWLDRPQRVARIEELVDDVDEDPYIAGVLRPAGLRYEVQASCAVGGRAWGHLCIRRRPEDGPFAGHELRFLAALVPHLTAGLRAATVQTALAARPGSETGVVILGPDGRIELANGIAQRLFARPVSGTRHSYLTAVTIVAAMLERALTDEGAATVPVVTLTDETSGESYRLRAERIAGVDGQPRGLVLIEPATTLGPVDTTQALLQLGLTEREAAVALAVLRGRTTLEIATELVISPHTVHDHLRNIFTKLDVGSRQQLAVRLLSVA